MAQKDWLLIASPFLLCCIVAHIIQIHQNGRNVDRFQNKWKLNNIQVLDEKMGKI